MSDNKLDDMLTSMSASLPPAVEDQARRVSLATMPGRFRRSLAPRGGLAPVLVAGAIGLTAGAGTANLAMSHWAGIEMRMSNAGNSVPLPVTWTTESGHVTECRVVWLEVGDPVAGDREILDEAISAREWPGFGQQMSDTISPVSDDADGGSMPVWSRLFVPWRRTPSGASPGPVRVEHV